MNTLQTKTFQLATSQAGKPDAPKLAVVLPGLFDTKDYAHIQSHLKRLAELGFHAVSFDPPGTWESPGGIELYTPSNYLQAVHEVIDRFGKPTFVMGHSRGATMSLASGSSNKLVFALAAVMPSHIRGDYLGNEDAEWKAQGHRLLSRDLPPGGGERSYSEQLPYSFFLDQLNFDCTDSLQASSVPKLFIYGASDTSGATPQSVRAIYEQAGEPKEIHEIPGDHDYRQDPDRIEMVNQIVTDFLNNLPQGNPT